MKTLNDLVDGAASEAPSKTSFVTPTESVTFSELRARVLSTAAGLAERGVKKGDCVAIVHRNGLPFITSYLALSRLGAVAVPLNFMVQKPEELAYMLNDCKALGVVTQREFLPGLRGAAAKCPALKTLWISDAQPGAGDGLEKPFTELAGDPARLPPPQAAEKDTATILYTSGTTGNPKGAMLTHLNLVSNAESIIAHLGLRSSVVGLCILPMFHSFAWTCNVLVSLRLRAKLVISPSITPAKPWLNAMARHGVSLFSAVPQLYSVLAKQATGLQGLFLRWIVFRKVPYAISGAAPLSPLVQEAYESNLRMPLVEGYGLTETSPAVSLDTPAYHRRGSVGKVIPGVRVKITDDAGKELPAGEEGEICVSGENVMKGYHNLPEATRESFTADGWLKTGDIGVLDKDGFLYLRDRKKDMIIIKGLKVFSAQVEAVIMEHPDVEEAAIIGIPDEHEDERIKAFVVLRKGAQADKAALMKFCREKLDPYKRPRDIEIVDSLPKNALQKVLKRALRQQELDSRRRA